MTFEELMEALPASGCPLCKEAKTWLLNQDELVAEIDECMDSRRLWMSKAKQFQWVRVKDAPAEWNPNTQHIVYAETQKCDVWPTLKADGKWMHLPSLDDGACECNPMGWLMLLPPLPEEEASQ